MMPRAAVAIVSAAFALVCGMFVWQPHIASFADDSVSYLLAAQAFSPWHGASALVLDAFRREPPYPPLYPLLLAVTGAAHDLRLAHLLSALMVAAWLPLAYLLGVRWLQSRAAAACAVFATASLPALWINAKGILSEPLYGLALLGTLYVLEQDGSERKMRILLAILLSALVLTRSAGLLLVAAYFVWAMTRRERLLSERMARAWPALVAVGAYALWVLLRPAESSDENATVLLQGTQALASAKAATVLATIVGRQADAIAEAWVGSIMVYWVPGRPVPVAIAALIGALSLAGLALRLGKGRADAWIAAGYLATFLLWPFYDQMGRFLFPILPVLVPYAFHAAQRLGAGLKRQALVPGLLALALLSLEIPALAFVYQRARIGGAKAEIVDWYRTPGLEQADARSRVHLDLLADMEEIRRITPPDARVMWVTPGYVAFLAERHGLRSPDAALPPAEYRRAVESSGAQYVFLSAFHPRDTVHDTAWRAGLEAMLGHAEVVHSTTDASGTRLTSLLLKVGEGKATR